MWCRLIRDALPASRPSADVAAPEELLIAVRAWARRGIDLRTLTRTWRGAQTVFWRYWMADVTARISDEALRAGVLQHSWEQASAWFDVLFWQVEALYTDERDRWVRGAQARRAELIRAILAGEPIDVEQASVTLGYDLRRVHTAIVLSTEDKQPDALTTLEEAVRELARAGGGGATLTHVVGPSTLWAWIGTHKPPTDVTSQRFAGAVVTAAVFVAVGSPARGVEGLRASHQQAELVRRQMPFGGRLAGFDEVGLACLIAGEPDVVRQLVASALGGLAQRDPGVARLRETVRVYLECGANAREAAERLHMHKNTVHYRVARAEEVRGRPIGERRLELEIALMLAHTLGERVLPD